AVRAARIERGRLALWRFDHLSEHLARAGLIEARLWRGLLHRLEHPRDAERGELAREHGLIPRRLDEALRGTIGGLFRLKLLDSVRERRLVEQVSGHELDAVDEMSDPLIWSRRAATHDADDAIVLLEQQLGEIRAVLARDTSDERSACHDGWWRS